jgi:hypothetical protein
VASIVYNSYLSDVYAGNCSTANTYKVMLVSSAYTENRSTHTKRSDITSEVSGTGYTAGGVTVALSFAVNNTTNVGTITIAGATWATSTITARKAIVYRARGGASSADELVACLDNGSDMSSAGTAFAINASTWTIPLPAPV